MYLQYKEELLLPAIIHVLRTHWATQCTHKQKHSRKWIMTRYRETSISLARFRTIYKTRCLDIFWKIKHDGKKIEKPRTVKNVRSWPSRRLWLYSGSLRLRRDTPIPTNHNSPHQCHDFYFQFVLPIFSVKFGNFRRDRRIAESISINRVIFYDFFFNLKQIYDNCVNKIIIIS